MYIVLQHRTFAISNPLPIETSFNTFANRANPDQAALTRSGSTLFAYGNMIYLILHQWTWQVIYFSMYQHESLFI